MTSESGQEGFETFQVLVSHPPFSSFVYLLLKDMFLVGGVFGTEIQPAVIIVEISFVSSALCMVDAFENSSDLAICGSFSLLVE